MFTVIPSILLTSIVYMFTKNEIRNNYQEAYIQHTFMEMDSILSSYIQEINFLCLDLTLHPTIYKNVMNAYAYRTDFNVSLVNEIISNYISNSNLISLISIITDNGINFQPSPDRDITPISEDFLKSFSNTYLSIYSDIVSDKYGIKYVVFGKRYYNYKNNTNVGNIIIYVQANILENTYASSLLHNSDVFITVNDCVLLGNEDYAGKVLYIPSNTLDNETNPRFHKNEYTYNVYHYKNKSLADKIDFVAIVSYRQFQRFINSILLKNFYIFLITSVIAITLSTLFSKNISKQISELANSLSTFSHTGVIKKNKTTTNELIILENKFEQMASEIQLLIERNNAEKESKRIAELSALQAQINPHFLYNTLDIINCMAKLRNEREIEDISYALASFFRISLHKGENIIKIREEIELVKNYVYIQNVRFANKFTVYYDIDDRILDCDIIKIILQPIVENSIKHGFNNIDYQGVINIRGKIDENHDIVFEIEDNGVGCAIEDDKIPQKKDPFSGYGLYNVNERLIIEYGEKYRLRFSSSPHKGTVVTVKIPFIKSS